MARFLQSHSFMSVGKRTAAEAEAAPWIERGARLGFAAMGVVYFIVGFLAIRAAMGIGRTTDPHGALGVLLHQPFGRVILAIVAIGLLGFAVWRLLDAARDLSRHGSDLKGKAIRAGMAARAFVYAAFGVEAGRIAIRGWSAANTSDQHTRHWTARLLELPFGRTLLVLVGLCVVGYGIYQVTLAFRRKIAERLHIASLAPATRRKILAISRSGIAARGVVFGIIGYFLLQAALRRDPGEARDISGALGAIPASHYGSQLLIVIGAGLIAYAVYQFASSLYRPVAV
jgi:hypothetical protein